MPEQWLPVVGYEGRYEVSDSGVVRSVRSGRIMKARISNCGYMRVWLNLNGEQKPFSVHRLVAFAFLGRPIPPRVQVAHGDGDRRNNRASNLRWATAEENQADRILHGTADRPKGESHGMSKLTKEMVSAIRLDMRRQREIAKSYGISQSQVSHIKTKASWVNP